MEQSWVGIGRYFMKKSLNDTTNSNHCWLTLGEPKPVKSPERARSADIIGHSPIVFRVAATGHSLKSEMLLGI